MPRKLDPFTVSVNPVPPEATLVGFSPETVGKTRVKAPVSVEVEPPSWTTTFNGTELAAPTTAGAKVVRIAGVRFSVIALAVMADGTRLCDVAAEESKTLAPLLKLLPLIVRTKLGLPTLTVVGDTEVAVGGGFTMNETDPVVPSGCVTVIASVSGVVSAVPPMGIARYALGRVAEMEVDDATVTLVSD